MLTKLPPPNRNRTIKKGHLTEGIVIIILALILAVILPASS